MWIVAVCTAVMGWGGLGGGAEPERTGVEVTGSGWVTDASHPVKPGDFGKVKLEYRAVIDQGRGEAVLQLTVAQAPRPRVYFFRQGRVFPAEGGVERIGDLDMGTVAALHPVLLEMGIAERRDNTAGGPAFQGRSLTFAWNDQLWTVLGALNDAKNGLHAFRNMHHEVYGDGVEDIRYSDTGVVVKQGDRPVAELTWRERPIEFKPDAGVRAKMKLPAFDAKLDRSRVIPPEEMTLRRLADPHLYALESATANARVFVAEFSDHLVVFEGAYNSRNCEAIAGLLKAQFGKPVKYFAFSHIHGQYIGGVRAWVHEGATVLAPPSCAGLVRQIAASRFDLRPDALALEPKQAVVEAVPEKWTHADDLNEMVIHNTQKSGHTDEYFIVHFPRSGVVLTGDLLLMRVKQPFTGRSVALCGTLAELGIEVKMAYVTWPLRMDSTKSEITGEEYAQARKAAAEAGAANNDAKPAEKPR